jgi:hypothetical protein
MSDIGPGQPPSYRDVRKAWIFSGLAWVGAAVFLDVVALINRGGAFSIAMAVQAANAQAPSVGIDSRGLLSLGFALSALAIIPFFVLVKAEVENRLHLLLCLGITFALGALISGALNQSAVPEYMSAHGYNRCAAGDYAIGNGKGRVWFDNYVLSPADCRPTNPARGR